MKKIIQPTEVARGRPEDYVIILDIRKDEIEFIETIRKANKIMSKKYFEILDRPEHSTKWGFLDFPQMSFFLFNPSIIIYKGREFPEDEFESWSNPKFHFNTVGDLSCEITSPFDEDEYLYTFGLTFEDSSNIKIL